jgi:hypothetical protein
MRRRIAIQKNLSQRYDPRRKLKSACLVEFNISTSDANTQLKSFCCNICSRTAPPDTLEAIGIKESMIRTLKG